MTHTLRSVRFGVPRSQPRRVSRSLLAISAAPVEAGQRRARLSRDLADRLAARVDAPADVIVSATDEQVAADWRRATARGSRSGCAMRSCSRSPGDSFGTSAPTRTSSAVSGDVPVRAMGVTAEAIGADQVWEGGAFEGLRGFTGRGIGVAIIDTGIDASHPRAAQPGGAEPGLHRARRLARHATRTATARTSPASSREVAPGAHLISLRAMGADGSGQTSDVLEAFDWVIENRRRLEHQGGQRLARASGDGVGARRSAVPGGAAGDGGGDSGDRGRGQLRARRPRARPIVGGIIVAGQLALGADRRARSTRSRPRSGRTT